MTHARAESLRELKLAYLFVSDHQALLDEALARLKDRVAAEADLALNLDEFDAEDTDAEEVITAARMMPFLSDKRVVVVKRAHKWRAAQLEAIAAYLGDPAPDACLVLTYLTDKDAKGSPLRHDSALYKAAAKNGYLNPRPGPKKSGSEFAAWVVKRAREKGLLMDPAAAAYLVEAAGKDLVTLIQEIDKLALVYEKGARLDLDAVEAMVSPYDRAKLWDYVDAAFSGRLTSALAGLEDLCLDGQPTKILGGLASRLRELLVVRALMGRGMRSDEVARALKQPDWRAKKQVELARRFSLEDLEYLFECVVRAEEDMKTSRLDGRLALDRMTVKICRLASPR